MLDQEYKPNGEEPSLPMLPPFTTLVVTSHAFPSYQTPRPNHFVKKNTHNGKNYPAAITPHDSTPLATASSNCFFVALLKLLYPPFSPKGSGPKLPPLAFCFGQILL